MPDAILAALSFGNVFEPPSMVLARIAVAPFGRGNRANLALEVRKVPQPVIAFT